jgi:hypothetical protein
MTEFLERYPPCFFPLLRQSKPVKRTLSACAIALFAVSLVAIGAGAETKPGAKTTRAAASNSAVDECFKRSGGSYNPVTKRWTIYAGEADSTLRSDTLRQCIGRATGVSPGSITLGERWYSR